ncbi:glycosyltransferase family 4 protein [Sphingomonas albertensis]|uniref:Glycosyltransferase family 4 protein n=1 Tax=Sphingomonas albertensis TaxID=2762591 RepID=A0ABR7ALJ4_9SPHN|nr:glycosyltransferase family 4 protein [Sphingomonas albertensis]MBC3941301.1 glycosyltransferase family 4 protein [Sphingomonas albertensis]
MASTVSPKSAILFYGGFASQAGGAFMHTTTFSAGLRARGWSVTTITLECLPLLVRYLPHIVEKLINVLFPPLGFYYKGRVTKLLYKHFIERKPNDLLVFEDIYLAWNSKNPSVSILHAVWSDNLQAYNLTDHKIDRLKRKEVAAIKNISHEVITVSSRYKNFIEKVHLHNMGIRDLKVVELGLDVNIESLRAAQIEMNGIRSLIYCGSLEARKNVYFMFEVFARILAADPMAALTIVGDGPDREGLKRYSAEHNLNVTFLGRLSHEQVLKELPKHNIYIHTALKESFSFALLEAKLAGLTTCALANLEVPEEFIDLGFETFDPADWSSQILSVEARPDMRDFPDYSIKRMTDHTLSLVSMSDS